MSELVRLRGFSFPEDYPGTLKLWLDLEQGVKVGASDTREEIEKKLQRDPDLFLIAEFHDEIIGTIIGGFDGRRGMIYHLAVRSDFRQQGIATRLIEEVEKRLREKGCLKCYLLVFADNAEAIGFYEQRGWRHMQEDIVFGKEFS